jgi:hypothetical protein
MKPWEHSAAIRAKQIDYSKCVTMPIRDMHCDGRIVFCVDVYGLDARDLAIIPGGSAPLIHAVERIGLDSNRFQATLWDVPL